jgi:hypothetical protein
VPTTGTTPKWWQYADLAGYTVAQLLANLRKGNRYVDSDLGKWFPINQEDAYDMLRKLPDLSNAAWRLLRLIVHYGGFHVTSEGVRHNTLSLMDADGDVTAYYNAVYNGRGPLFPLPVANPREYRNRLAQYPLSPKPGHSYHMELSSWLLCFKPSANRKHREFINQDWPPVEDVLYAEGISPIVVEYWGGTRREYYDHTNIQDKERVRSLRFSHYPFLDRFDLDAEGYVNLAEIFVDGVVTDLPQGATDGRIRVIHGIRPCDHCSWMGSLRTPRIREYNPLVPGSYTGWHDITQLLSTRSTDARAAYVPVLTTAGYNAMQALLRPVPDAQKENYNRATRFGITIFPNQDQQTQSVFEQIGLDGSRFDVRASILNEPTVMDVASGIREHWSGFVVREPSEACLLKPSEVIVPQDVLLKYHLPLPGTRLLLLETLDNRFALDHLAIHLSGDTMSRISDPQSPHFSNKSHEKFRSDFKDALVQFGSSEIMAVPTSFVVVRQQLELSPGVVNCVGWARRIAAAAVNVAPDADAAMAAAADAAGNAGDSADAGAAAAPAVPAGDVSEPADADAAGDAGDVSDPADADAAGDAGDVSEPADAGAAAEPAVPEVSWREPMRIASKAGLGLGRKDVFPRALVAFVADKIKNEFPDQTNETCQWWLASQVAVALGSSNYKKNEKFGNNVVECIKDESWYDIAEDDEWASDADYAAEEEDAAE